MIKAVGEQNKTTFKTEIEWNQPNFRKDHNESLAVVGSIMKSN